MGYIGVRVCAVRVCVRMWRACGTFKIKYKKNTCYLENLIKEQPKSDFV